MKVQSKLFLFLSILILVLSTSCQNFMKGDDVKSMIEEYIEYSNASKFTIRVEPELPDMGTVSGNSEKIVRVTDDIKLSFLCSSSYVFCNWKVYVDGVEDISSEYIKIEDPFNATTNAKVLKASDKILIRPVCSVYLKVDSVYPDWGYVSPKDTDITVKFNTIIDISNFRFSMTDFENLGLTQNQDGTQTLVSYVKTFKDADGLIYAYTLYDDENSLTFKSIQINNGDTNYLQYFEAPFVKGNTLTIPVKTDNFIPMIDGEIYNINVNIENVVSGKGIGMSQPKNWIYRINSGLSTDSDKVSPSMNLKTSKDFDSMEKNELISAGDFASLLTSDSIYNNIVNDKLAIDCSATDRETGIKKITIIEKHLKNTDGTDSQDSTELKTEYTGSALTYSEDGFTATLKTNHRLLLNDDGAILITIIAEDFNHNPTKESFTVIRDTCVNLEGWKLYNIQDIENSEYIFTKKINTGNKERCKL